MEQADKKEYFQYYKQPNPSIQSSHSKERIKLEKKRYENNKLLPHIAEEYHFRITNHLLLKKIISPKRDKIIMQALDSLDSHSLLVRCRRRIKRRATPITFLG